MEMRSATPAKKKPSVGRVKPIPRANQKVTSSTPAPVNATTTASLRRPQLRSGVTQTSLLRERSFCHLGKFRPYGKEFAVSYSKPHFYEARDEPIPDVFSHMMENPQSDTSLQNALQDVLSDVKKSLKEDMRISNEYNEQKLEELTHRFEQLLRQQEYAHQQEVLELQGSIEYLQEKLVSNREQKEVLEQKLEDANQKILERSEEMGSIRAEVSDLRREVQELRAYKAKHMREMQNVEKLRKELEVSQAVNRITREEFAKIEDERDELREEFEKSLQKIKLANQRRNRTIEEELDETMDELLS
ncbi:hypothetical protein ANCCEY_07918 [Ancylostoma ceylanicum]|uniref:Uncharacterized protein n=2 Tax=Ancylostoma ceylanicum TaxID=53326 RepID=A0A0D6LZE7_9BILA|nr:hypothetical protein ANCCEY_07918 [Ancylostoma ceylanicum]